VKTAEYKQRNSHARARSPIYLLRNSTDQWTQLSIQSVFI